ncbi:hypothetical protein BpHYR1_016646, partial [Brachionus plicatilis]
YVSFTKLLSYGYYSEECINLANLFIRFALNCSKVYVSFTKLLSYGYFSEECINWANLFIRFALN